MSHAKAKQWRIDEAMAYAERVRENLEELVDDFAFAGSLARGEAWIGDIDIVVWLDHVNTRKLRKIQRAMKRMGRWKRGGERMMVVHDLFSVRGLRLDLFIVYPPRNFEAMLALRRGPAQDTVRLVEGLIANGHARPHSELQVEHASDLFRMAGL